MTIQNPDEKVATCLGLEWMDFSFDCGMYYGGASGVIAVNELLNMTCSELWEKCCNHFGEESLLKQIEAVDSKKIAILNDYIHKIY